MDDVIYLVFFLWYWFVKEEVVNKKIVVFLEMIEFFGFFDMKFFKYRLIGDICKMFFIFGLVIKNVILEKK